MTVRYRVAPKGMRCVWLDPNAKRCRRLAIGGDTFHGDPEWCRCWIIAYFCARHIEHGTGKCER